MFAHPVGMADPAAALTESAGLTLKWQNPVHHSSTVALGRTEIHELMGPPDGGHHRAFDPLNGRGFRVQLENQALPQLAIIGRRGSKGAPSEQALAGGSGCEEERESLDSLGCRH